MFQDLSRMVSPASLIDDSRHASWMHERIVRSINAFENKLPDDYEAGGRLVSFGQTVKFHIVDVRYWNPDMIIFEGTMLDGSPVELLQHSSQLSLLLVALKRNNSSTPRRKIGFSQPAPDSQESDLTSD